MHVLIDDDLGRLTLRRLWPWHRLLARCLAPGLDRRLADGVRPEADAVLAARAMILSSGRYRRGLAAASRPAGSARQPYAPPRPAPIAGSAAELDGLARSLAGPMPVPAMERA